MPLKYDEHKRKKCIVSNTLCWTCAKSGGLCSWSKEFKAVEGWEAEPTTIKSKKNVKINSFNVIKCPEFILDRRNKKL